MLNKRSGRPWFCNEFQANAQGKLHLVQVPTHLTSLRYTTTNLAQAGRPLTLFAVCQLPCQEVFCGHAELSFAFSDSQALLHPSWFQPDPTCKAPAARDFQLKPRFKQRFKPHCLTVLNLTTRNTYIAPYSSSTKITGFYFWKGKKWN